MVAGRARPLLEFLWRTLDRVVDPLRSDEDLQHFTLAIPEAHTTTIHGDTGWPTRPPAILACPDCEADVYQHRSRDPIDCSECWWETPAEQFADVELRYLRCPECGNRMDHGRRHPGVLDVPEWATCERCRYHWELGHFY